MQRSPQTKGDLATEEILSAAKSLFLKQGYNGTSMRAIAHEAGDRSVAGLYNHFPTKRAIFEALIKQYNPYEEMLSTLEAIQADSAPEFVEAVFKLVIPLVLRHFDFIQLVQIDIREFQGATIGQIISTVVPRGLSIIQGVQKLPGIKQDEGLFMIRFFASLILGYAFTEKMMPAGMFDQASAEEWATKFASYVLYGLAAQEN